MLVNWEEEAKWIWTPDWTIDDENEVGSFVYFRKTFNLENGPHQAKIKVSADSRYRLFVNGVSVSFGPCKGDRFTWYYETVDISSFLRAGENVIAAQVLRYSPVQDGNESVWRTRLAGLYVHGIIRDSAGHMVNQLHTDESWRCMKDTAISLSQGIYTVFLGITEEVDGLNLPFEWNVSGYDDGDWLSASAYQFDTLHGVLKPWVLTERAIPLMKEENRRFSNVQRVMDSEVSSEAWLDLLYRDVPLTIPAHSKVIAELDAGELTTGFLQLAMSQGAETKISLLCAECYEQEPKLVPWMRDKGDRTDSETGSLCGDYDIYCVAGMRDKFETYEPFWFRTFRYVRIEIETKGQPLTLHQLDYRETGYPLEVMGHFNSSDGSYSKLWDISLRTLQLCMHESYEDCPYYEQLQYAMDTRSQILFTFNVSGDDRLARKTFYDFHSSLLPQGLTQSRYPSHAPQVIPGFSLYWIHMLHDHMMYYGDVQLMKRYGSSVDAVLDYYDRMLDERGLVGVMPSQYWSFIDWTDEWKESFGVPTASHHGLLTIHSLMYAAALRKAAEMAAFVGREGVASEYRERAERICTAVVANCRSIGNSGMFTDGPGVELFSQQTQIWAVLSETVKGEEAKQLMEITLANDSIPKSSFAMSFYLFRALAATNLYDRVHSLWEPWRKMVDQNLTTWMEDTVSQRSDCHGWGAVPLYEFTSEILGVQPETPGYGSIRVRPRVDHLTWAKGQVATPKGLVKVEWHRSEGEFIIWVDGPEQTPLTLILPDGNIQHFKSAASVQYILKL
ncbi:alpha-L-rhamnosidase C-terminal domain-containing protein [Paenibacillus sp. NRS-1782]|uniref:alpha-L-rhamnosidase-related protein n=1 Tax=unclassified Paenibacillus TaxID=185978 RepID=UPI003D2B0515